MMTEKNNESEGMTVSFGSLIALVGTFIFGAALGLFLALFLAPGSDLALVLSLGLFPAVLLGGGFLVEELWFLKLWQRQPRRWQWAISDPAASPATLAERQRAAVFLPLGFVVGGIGGVAVGLTGPGVPILVCVFAYAMVGFAYGGCIYSLVQFSALPSLGQGKPLEPPSESTPSKTQ